jgi:hypothetical protein
MPSSSCFSSRFGSLVRAYTLIGWDPDRDFSYVEINRSIRRRHADLISAIFDELLALGATVSVDSETDLLKINSEYSASLEGTAIVDVGTDVFGVDEHLMHSRPCPQVTVLPENAGAIELLGDLALSLLVRDKPCVDLLDDLGLILGARDEDDPVRLQALPLSPAKQPFGSLIAID